MNYTPQQFNEMAAKVEGKQYEIYNGTVYEIVSKFKRAPIKPHNDLNQLMPLVFKYDIEVTRYIKPDLKGKWWKAEAIKAAYIGKDPIQAIRDCLWRIWQEGNTNE